MRADSRCQAQFSRRAAIAGASSGGNVTYICRVYFGIRG